MITLDIRTVAFLLNYFMALLFGLALCVSFSGLEKTRRNSITVFMFLCGNGLMQGALYFLFGFAPLTKLYPILVHLPIVLYLHYVGKKKWTVAFAAMLCAYMLTIPRQWIGTFAASLVGRGITASYLVQSAVTLPLLFVLDRWVAPSVRNVLGGEGRTSFLFSAFALTLYLFNYATTVFSDYLYDGSPVLVEFLLTCLIISYFVFNVLYYRYAARQEAAKQEQEVLRLLAKQAEETLEHMRGEEMQAAVFRHDLRHHLNYLDACLEKNDGSARAYIRELTGKMQQPRTERFCENDTVNLLLGAYCVKAEEEHTVFTVQAQVNKALHIADSDLCILLSNALENAIHAGKALPPEGRQITVQLKMRGSQLFVSVQNNCKGPVEIKNGLPVTDAKGHGFGAASIAATVKKYGGVYTFSIDHNVFCLQFVA